MPSLGVRNLQLFLRFNASRALSVSFRTLPRLLTATDGGSSLSSLALEGFFWNRVRIDRFCWPRPLSDGLHPPLLILSEDPRRRRLRRSGGLSSLSVDWRRRLFRSRRPDRSVSGALRCVLLVLTGSLSSLSSLPLPPSSSLSLVWGSRWSRARGKLSSLSNTSLFFLLRVRVCFL